MGAAVLEMVRGEEDVVGRYERFVRRVREMRLEGAYNDKSIVDVGFPPLLLFSLTE